MGYDIKITAVYAIFGLFLASLPSFWTVFSVYHLTKMTNFRENLVTLKTIFEYTNRIHKLLLVDANKREAEKSFGELWNIIERDCHRTADKISVLLNRHFLIEDLDTFWSTFRGYASGVDIVEYNLSIYEEKVQELLLMTRRIMNEQKRAKNLKKTKAKARAKANQNTITALRGAKKTIVGAQAGGLLNLKKLGALLELRGFDEEEVAAWLDEPVYVSSDDDFEYSSDGYSSDFPDDDAGEESGTENADGVNGGVREGENVDGDDDGPGQGDNQS